MTQSRLSSPYCAIPFLVLASVLTLSFTACSLIPGRKSNKNAELIIKLQNPTSQPATLTLDRDGTIIQSRVLAPGQTVNLPSISLQRDWTRITARRDHAEDRPVLVREGTARTLTIRIDNERPGGIGLHLQD